MLQTPPKIQIHQNVLQPQIGLSKWQYVGSDRKNTVVPTSKSPKMIDLK